MAQREAPIQRAIVNWLRTVLPGAIVHHAKGEIKQRGKAIAVELARARADGAMPGFPDLVVLPFAHVGPLFLEVKAPGNYPSPAQRGMHEQLARLGYRVAVVRSVEDVRAKLAEWAVWTAEK